MPHKFCVGSAIAAALAFLPSSAVAQPTYEVLHAFHGLPGRPKAPLLQASDGALYGTTTVGGQHGAGQVFAVRPRVDGGFTFVTVYDFEKGNAPSTAALVEGPDGALYGTTPEEHPNSGTLFGTIFKVTKTGAYALLRRFDDPNLRQSPETSLVLGSDGYLYGVVTDIGGSSGAVFKIS